MIACAQKELSGSYRNLPRAHNPKNIQSRNQLFTSIYSKIAKYVDINKQENQKLFVKNRESRLVMQQCHTHTFAW
jgi:hypothetical protein